MTGIIRTSGLVKRFGKVVALDGLDLEVPGGTVLGLLGPNGAGKTTAVRILTTLLVPDEGTVEVAGLDVRTGRLPEDLGVAPGWAEVVLLLDVIEHVDDDGAALAAARRAVAAGGLLVVTVPAYRWLWSGHDEVLGHRRRYTAAGLRAVVERAGFSVLRVSYFNSLLFPMVALVRLWKGLRGDRGHDLRRPAAPLNRLLERVFAFERHLVPRVALPFGASLLLIGRR